MSMSEVIQGTFAHPLSGNVHEMLLFKIQKRKYLEELQHGKLYMKNLQYHNDFGKQDPNSTVGDEDEGLIVKADNVVFQHEGIDMLEARNVRLSLSPKSVIFCCMAVKFDTIEANYMYFRPPSQIISDFIQDDGEEYAAILLDRKRFLERCDAKLKDAEFACAEGPVMYSDDVVPLSDIGKERCHAAFRKRMKYSHQQEYRLWLDANVDDHYVLDICDLSDISVIIPIESAKHGVRIAGNFQEVSDEGKRS